MAGAIFTAKATPYRGIAVRSSPAGANRPGFFSHVLFTFAKRRRETTERRAYNAADPLTTPLLHRTVSRRYYGADQRLRVVQSYVAAYDTANQSATQRRGTFEEYRYDPLGRRIMVYGRRPAQLCNVTGCADHTDRFIWNGDQVAMETRTGTGGGTVKYVHGLGIDQPGRHRETFGDEPNGPRIPAWHGSLIQDQVDGSGLQYRRNRYYDPKAGVFTQEDPIGLAGGMNLYGFAGGDPVNFSDPFGLCPDEKRKNTICVSFFIEAASAWGLRGDDRDFQVQSPKEQSRAWIVIDVENQRVVDKGFSTTCTASESICNDPSILSQVGATFGSNGQIDVSVLGHNSITLGPAFSGYLRFTPDGNGGYSSQGFATRFPSIEAYYHNAAGEAQKLIQQRGSHPACLAFCGVGPIRP